MTTTETLYDLVFFGTDLQGDDRLTALNHLSQAMRVPPDQVARVLDERHGVIARNLTSEQGTEAVRKLAAIGIRSNIRPSVESGPALSLVSKDASVVAPKAFDCPACGHRHPLSGGGPAPTQCEQCGIVFAKYEKLAEEKLERERIRQSLLGQRQRKLDQEQQERELREAKERRERLEEEIRRELGLPRAISTRSRLIGSAAGLTLVSMSLGVVAGGLGYKLFLAEGGKLPPSTRQPLSAQAASEAIAGSGLVDPGMQAQLEVAGLLSQDPDDAGHLNGPPGAELGVGLGAKTAGTGRAGTSGQKEVPEGPGETTDFLSNQLAALATDTEWDLFLLTRMEALLKQGEAQSVVDLVDQLRNPELRYDRGARIAEALRQRGRSGEAAAVYERLSASADQKKNKGLPQVTALCTLVRHLKSARRTAEADALTLRAEASAVGILQPAERAAADGEIGALLTNLGRDQPARASFKAATDGLARVTDPAQRLTTIARLAGAYAKAGYRATALSLLEEAGGKVDTVQDDRDRSRVLEAIAQGHRSVGDLGGARAAAARIKTTGERDRVIHGLVVAEIASNRLANAIDLSDDVQTPSYRALTQAQLRLHQQEQPTFQPLASLAGARADTALASITSPAEKASVSAELGRLAVYRGDAAAAQQYFSAADELVKEVLATPVRDKALAILMTNQALALRPADKGPKVSEIADGTLRTALAADLDQLAQAASSAGLMGGGAP